MLEIRKDYLTGMKVLMSGERANRPNFFNKPVVQAESHRNCPFCEHNRHMIETVVSVEYGGRIKTIVNKFPAVKESDGVHEVVVDSNVHGEYFASFSVEDIAASLTAISGRYKSIMDIGFIQYIQIFKNDGAGSGASIAHSHWQILGLPFIPQRQVAIHSNFRDFYKARGISYIESLYSYKELIVYENDLAFAYMPCSSPYDYNINIAPKRHINSTNGLSRQEISSISQAVKAVLGGLALELGEFPFNICMQQIPKGSYEESHFYIEIVPRLGGFAGLELGAQVYINGHIPEETAPRIRSHIERMS